jgi:hypothetical protein
MSIVRGRWGFHTSLESSFHENKNMAFKWCTCVGIEEKWEVQRMYDPHFLPKGA